MKRAKKQVSIILAVMMVITLLVGCKGKGEEQTKTSAQNNQSTEQGTQKTEEKTTETTLDQIPEEQYTIAFAMMTADESTEIQKRYMNEEIAPAFHVNFIFSEKLDDAEDLIAFMENAYSAGAKGVVNFISNAHEAGAAKAEELGMYFITQASTHYASVEKLSFNLGELGASPIQQGEVFREVTKEVTNDGNAHNYIIVSGGSGMGVMSHLETTKAILTSLQEDYGLTYDKPIDELATVTAITEVTTGKDTKITIFPGFGGPTYVSDFSSLLQTGDYDVILSTYPTFQTFGVAIDEVEKSFKMDIKQITVTSISDPTKTAFNTMDSNNKPILDGAVINSLNNANAMCFALVYNALSGYVDTIKPDGKAGQYGVPLWKVVGADHYNNISKLDMDHATYCINSDDMKSLLCIYNSKVNASLFQETLDELTADKILEKVSKR